MATYVKATIYGYGGSPVIEMNKNLIAGNNFYVFYNTKELITSLNTRRSDTPKQAGHGSHSGLSFYNSRILPFAGEIHAQSHDDRLSMEADLQLAVGLAADQDFNGDDGYRKIVLLDEDGLSKQIYAKLIDIEFNQHERIPERASRFRFTMVADEDVFLYEEQATTENGMEGLVGTDVYFVDGEDPYFLDGEDPYFQDELQDTLTVTNDGTVATPPLIIIYGPTEDPVISNETTGKEIDLSNAGGLTLLAGERVEINVAALTITKVDGSDVETDASGYMTPASEWIFLRPGDNVLLLLDASPAETLSTFDVTYRSAWA